MQGMQLNSKMNPYYQASEPEYLEVSTNAGDAVEFENESVLPCGNQNSFHEDQLVHFPLRIFNKAVSLFRTAVSLKKKAIGLEEEILQRFPSEKLEFYRVSKRGKIYNKYGNLRSSFNILLQEFYRVSKRGKIYNKYGNLRSSFKAAITCHVLPTKTKPKETKNVDTKKILNLKKMTKTAFAA
ncbi:protein of unknown function (DUF4769) [Popillia japonica]|uniref:Uncharacterized protein n=1 Tax=Popillia japonica TaxID=7064 RepID=A0AAW1MBV2_POPJA